MTCPLCETELQDKHQTSLYKFTEYLITTIRFHSPMPPMHKADRYTTDSGNYISRGPYWKITFNDLYWHEYTMITNHEKCAVCDKFRHGAQTWNKDDGKKTIRLSMRCGCYVTLTELDALNNQKRHGEIRKCVRMMN